MKFLSGVLLSIVFLPVTAQDFSDVEVTSQQVRDNIHVLFGAGGNIGVLHGDDGIVLIDDQFVPLASRIRAALAEIDPGQINFTINTHFHFDHSDGNKVFGPEGAWIVAHENTRKKLMNDMTIGGGAVQERVVEKYPDDALPKITFENSMKLHLNGQTVYLFHAANAHTDTDAIIYFPEANVFHTGDVFVRYGVPFIDKGNGGSVGGMIRAANQLIEMCDDETIIIPGHGQLSGKQDVKDFRDMLQSMWDDVMAAAESGKTVEEILENDPSARYGESDMGPYIVRLIYDEISK